MAKLLLVEDDSDLAEAIQDCLQKEKHAVDSIADGAEALERLRAYTYDAIILDWKLPGLSGIDVCRHYRAAGGTAPVIILTGQKELRDKEEGLDAGADDYVTKPFEPRELLARVRARLRRPHTVFQDSLVAGDLTLNPNGFNLRKGDNEIHLKPKELQLLEFFMRHPNEVFTLEALLDRVWPTDANVSPESLRVHITYIRSKIDTKGQPSYIQTVHRVGYRFQIPTSE